MKKTIFYLIHKGPETDSGSFYEYLRLEFINNKIVSQKRYYDTYPEEGWIDESIDSGYPDKDSKSILNGFTDFKLLSYGQFLLERKNRCLFETIHFFSDNTRYYIGYIQGIKRWVSTLK